MSNYRQALSASANDDRCNPRKLEMQATEVEEIAGMIMMAHYEDARLNPNNCGNKNDNNSVFSSEQANIATRIANISSHAPTTDISFNENPPSAMSRHACLHCSAPEHRQPECPLLPCKYSGLMGHLGADGPEMVKARAEWRQITSKRWHEINRANRK